MSLVPQLACAESFRIRAAWGGGDRATWQGSLQIAGARFSRLRLLGIEADEPGSIWLDGQRVQVRSRSGRTYDGFDVTVDASRDAEIRFDLAASGESVPSVLVAKLGDLLTSAQQIALDASGNRLIVRRAPGDSLRVLFEREHLVFSAGETFSAEIEPSLDAETGAELRLRATLTPARSETILWSQDYQTTATAAGEQPPRVSLEVPLPEQEGAYDVHITAAKDTIRRRLVPSMLARPLAQRTLQLVVAAGAARHPPADDDWREVGTVDPLAPSGWKQWLQPPRLQRLTGKRAGPWFHGSLTPREHKLGRLAQLERAQADPAWAAYPLPIESPGKPHLLEVEIPSDLPQRLGVSIVEQDAAGSVMPIGIDSGVHVPEEDRAATPTMLRHRVVFWPRTETPLALLVQADSGQPVAFGRLRVHARHQLSEPDAVTGDEGGRLWAGYLDRPLVPENFSATRVFDPSTGRALDDWRTFLEGSRRLVDYLDYSGHNGLMLSVLADGSTIYPSDLLSPTPRYDTGQLAGGGSDPVRKDAVELLLRLFARRNLKMIAAMDFSTPLPELEALLRDGGSHAAGIRLIDRHGRSYPDVHFSENHINTYYNPLDPRVQEAVLRVIGEFCARYRDHDALAGLALQLSNEGYAHLPGAQWGFDDATVARFVRATGVKMPDGVDEQRFGRRAEFLLGPGRAEWVQWRAAEMADFYRRVQEQIAATRPGAHLYLVPAGLFDNPRLQQRLRPSLPPSAGAHDLLLELGIDGQRLPSGVVLARTRRSSPFQRLPGQALDLQLNQSMDLEPYGRNRPLQAVLNYHPPHRVRLTSFERQGPFAPQQTFALLVAQPVTSGAWGRASLAKALATGDAGAVFDGGWLLPSGDDDAIRPPAVAFTRLPAGKFQTSSASRQPVIIRTRSEADATYAYLVNDSPWSVSTKLRFETPPGCRLQRLGAAERERPLRQEGDGFAESFALEPYDVVAIRLSQPQATIVSADVDVPAAVRQTLAQRIDDLAGRAASLADPPEWKELANVGFEETAESGVPGWTLVGGRESQSGSSTDSPHSGTRAMRLSRQRDRVTLISDAVELPPTGRIALSVWIRSGGEQEPILRLAIDGFHNGQRYSRFARLGGAGPGAVAMKDEWTNYVFDLTDLPTSGLRQVRLQFDLLAAGDVWIDDIRLDPLKFQKNERVELSKILVSARGALDNGELSSCLRLMDGYWPQFLQAYVPRPSVSVASKPQRPQSPAKTSPAEQEDPDKAGGLRQYIPRFLRF